MLLSFRVANHRSLRDEQQLIMAPGDMDAPEFPAPEEISPLPVVGIFGPNASGKSNVVDALQFMQHLVRGGKGIARFLREVDEPEEGIARWPFRLDGESRQRPSVYVVDLLIEGERYTYGFAIDDTAVVEEWLYRYSPTGTEESVFVRTGDELAHGPEEGLFSITEVFEIQSNVLLMAVFANVQPKWFAPEALRALQIVSTWFRGGTTPPGGRRPGLWIRGTGRPLSRGRAARFSDPVLLERLGELLAAADTGIERIEVEKRSVTDDEGREREFGRWVFHHHGPDPAPEYTLGLEDQSRGTQALMDLGLDAINALDRGHTLVIDELDSSLHTLLSARLIELFRDPESNPNGAQLIFTSHDAALLGRIRGNEVLTSDQIWFIEKARDGASDLYPLSGYPQADEEGRARRYLTGRYGAVPFIDDDMFAAALAAREKDQDW